MIFKNSSTILRKGRMLQNLSYFFIAPTENCVYFELQQSTTEPAIRAAGARGSLLGIAAVELTEPLHHALSC